ncbi:unnamed protein product [Rhizoctonia solani]|nr:unnamed protein product [Rhizoctonia solani]
MSHPLHWPAKCMYSPIGSTAGISLTQDLLPEQSADILVLGCGDPRNILFTLYSDLTVANAPRKMDITCCDIEPAILARNILLFSLLEDGTETTTLIWDAFYHFKINDRTASLIEDQSRKIYDWAEDIQSWRRSPYGSFLKMVDTRSLTELRRHWKNYADFSSRPIDRRNQLLKEQKELTETVAVKGDSLPSSRSAGMLLNVAVFHMLEMFQGYWQTGTTSTEPSEVQNSTNLNPTFCYSRSGETFNPHPGTFPQGFHLVSAFAPVAEDPVGALPTTGSPAINKSKQQFTAWCSAFRVARAANAITLRFYCGDALAFCHALHELKSTGNYFPGLFSSAFRGTQIILDELSASAPSAPLTFDVIDTSTLADHVGLLNLLIAAPPLLKELPSSQSVLYTNSQFRSEDGPIKSFLEHICTDIPTLSVLLGISPRPYISTFSAQSNIHEMIFANKNILSVSGVTSDQGHQYQERITWTNPCSGDSHTSETFTATTFEAEDLAHLLLGMYSKMFALERSSHIVASVTPSELELLSRVTFNRESVAHLFKAVQRRCYLRNGTWDHVAKKFLEICGTGDDCPAEPSNYQDLCLQLHLAGVFTSETLRPDWATKSRLIPHSPLFDGWESIPPVVCVVLTVPRRRLQIFGGEVEGVNTLAMQCRLITGNLDHDHSSIHVIWGRCIKARDSDHMVIAEDDCGLFGHSNLLVTFWASACLLDSPDVKVDLRLKSTPESVIACGNILGVNLQVFSTSITDKHHVTILRYCPTVASEPLRYPPSGQQPDPPLPTWPGKVCEAVVTKPAKRHVDLLSVRFHITFPEEQKSLLKGVQVSAKQTSPCTMQLSIGEHIHPIVFSYPIQGRNSRVRIARKSQYVDIIVPVSKPLDHSGYFLDPFPVLGKHAYTSWNIHNLNLDRLPILETKTLSKLYWVNPLCAYQFSDSERVIRNGPRSERERPESALIYFKDFIHSIAMHIVGEDIPLFYQ